jgi:5-methylcytosine-specific restriction endonuclease McrBC GTP-binding regulatory subunit McrB
MKQITKEHILKAIQEIDNEGVRPGRNSSTYDLIYNDKPYPPKLILSIANKYATGKELDHNTFAGGQGTPAFNLLKNEGFIIKNKLDLANSSITRFSEAIDAFINYLKISDSIISSFTFGDYSSRSKYVWISDQLNIISDSTCHYELIQRKDINGNIGISVEIHFEDKFKKEYFSLLKDNLPSDVYWNDQHKPNISITYQNIFSYSDPELLIKIEAALVYLEINLGDKIRKIKDQVNSIYIKENFINWFISKDGIENNYFTQQFGGNFDRFGNEMNKYEEIYKKDFDKELFLINPNSLKEKIEEVQKNIYSNSLGFSEYSQANSNGRPKAILGKNNYIKFLTEYYLKNNENNMSFEKQNSPLNQILYGPPGTGKTYNTMNKAVCLIQPKFSQIENREILKAEYERLVEEGQIVFTTFHQSMSYEDFIEGIKPQTKNEKVSYSVKDGIFKNTVKMALSEYIKDAVETESGKDEFDQLYDSFIESIKSEEGQRKGTFTTKTGIEMMLVNANDKSIVVKYLWDNNKTKDKEATQAFSVSKEKLKKVLLEGTNPKEVKSLKAELDPIIGYIHCELFAVYKSFYDFVIANKGEVEAVHFNYYDQSYEEIKEQYDVLDKELIKVKEVKYYVLIIDEINRGNVSQIFGELITLIEDSKRLSKDESLEVTLPYSKEKFGVPPNLYIIGTMNTADRSVEALDTALRRRFCFEEMLPNLDILTDKSISGIDLKELLNIINKRIEILLDRDHTIGHSYFINIITEEQLKSTFKNNIIPLLQEYFYGDYEKIGMILGNGFFDEPQKFTKSIFADFTTPNYPDGGSILNLKAINDNFNIINALQILMKKPVLVNE